VNRAGGYISADLGDSSHDTRGRCKTFNSRFRPCQRGRARERKCLVDRSGQRFLDNVRRSSSESILIYVLKKKERTNVTFCRHKERETGSYSSTCTH